VTGHRSQGLIFQYGGRERLQKEEGKKRPTKKNKKTKKEKSWAGAKYD